MSKSSLTFVPALLLASTLMAQSAPEPRMMLRFAEFDPVQSEPVIPPSLMAATDSTLFMVQFKSLITEKNRAELRSVGAEIHTYIPDQSYLIRMDPTSLEDLQSLDSIRWVSPFHVAYKAEPEILADMIAGFGQTARYNIILVDPDLDAVDVEAKIAEVGGRVEEPSDGGLLLEATLSPQQLQAVLNHNGVQWVEHRLAVVQEVGDQLEAGGSPSTGTRVHSKCDHITLQQ